MKLLHNFINGVRNKQLELRRSIWN